MFKPRRSFFVSPAHDESGLSHSNNNLRINIPSLNNLNQSVQLHNGHFLTPESSRVKRSSILLPSIQPHELSRHTSEKQLNIGEKKILQYFERQSAAIDRLTERVKDQEKKEKFYSDRGHSSSRNHMNTLIKLPISSRSRLDTKKAESSDETYSDSESRSEGDLSEAREEVMQKTPKSQANALEALGKLYLMGKLSNTHKHNKERVPRPSILAILQNQLTEKEKEITKSRKEEDKEDAQVKKKSKKKKILRKNDPETDSLKEEHVEGKTHVRQRKYLKERRARLESSEFADSGKNKSHNDSSVILSKKGN